MLKSIIFGGIANTLQIKPHEDYMSYTKTSETTYLASNGIEYYGWVGRHVLDPDGYYSSKSLSEEDEISEDPPPTKERKCRICGETMPLFKFAKKPRYATSFPYYNACKECYAELNKDRDNYYAKKKMREYQNKKYKEDPIFRFISLTKRRIRDAIKNKRGNTSKELLGCSPEEAFNYLVSRFTGDMTIEDFMNGDIHIDHIKPVAAFDLTKEEELKQCFHYTNLQPLWALDNLKKGAKWDDLTE